jgi:dTDP-glucose pyrophosphorylase
MQTQKQSGIVALIPAGGGTTDVHGRTSNYPAALVHVNGTPIIISIIDQLISNAIGVIRIGINEEFRPAFDLALRRFSEKVKIDLINVSESVSLMNTLGLMSEGIDAYESILINFGDTLCDYNFNELIISECGIIVGEVSENENWSTVLVDQNGLVTDFYDKGTNIGTFIAQCGVYWWQDAPDFLSLSSVFNEVNEIGCLLKSNSTSKVHAIYASNWVDSDHSSYREESALNLIEARSFNQLSVDRFRGLITKKSQNQEKLIREIKYYEAIPSELRIFFPRMLDASKENESFFQVLEYYPYPNLSSHFVYREIPIHVWKKIFFKIRDILENEFSNYLENDKKYDLNAVFVERTKSRLNILKRDESLITQLLNADNLVINGKPFLGVNKILDLASQFVVNIESKSSFIHGDFCLSNILCELDTLNLKFIDPRGGFDTASCYGPNVYDIAKLGHSVVSGYDFIIADQFKIEFEPNDSSYAIELFHDANHTRITEIFYEVFTSDKLTRQQINLISGLTLIGVASFHLSHPYRALAMLLRGTEVCGEALEEFLENLH